MGLATRPFEVMPGVSDYHPQKIMDVIIYQCHNLNRGSRGFPYLFTRNCEGGTLSIAFFRGQDVVDTGGFQHPWKWDLQYIIHSNLNVSL